MATTPLILPAGLTVSTEGGRLTLHYEGDLVLRGTLGFAPDAIECIDVTGDLDLQAAVHSGMVIAGGGLRVAGTLRASARCGGDLEVGGDLQAPAQSGGAALVRGAIAAHLTAGGSVSAASVSAGDVDAGGDLHIEGDATGGDLRAGARVSVGGKVDAGSMRGAAVQLGDAEIKARSIAATQRIDIGASRLTVDVILAPEVRVAPAANGRVTVIESRNERPPTKIKGGFSVEDYEEMMGGAEAFLAERGVSPLPPREVSPPQEAPQEAPPDAPPPQAAAPASQAATPPEEAPSNPDAWLTDAEHTEEVGAHGEAAEDVDDPISLSVEDIEMVEEADEATERLREALRRIRVVYGEDAATSGGQSPPFLQTISALAAARDHAGLAAELPRLWNDLLDHHASAGTRPHHQVTHAFNLLHGFVQDRA